MLRLYERLAGLNALLAVLMMVLGLAMVPTAHASDPGPQPDCEGSCDALAIGGAVAFRVVATHAVAYGALTMTPCYPNMSQSATRLVAPVALKRRSLRTQTNWRSRISAAVLG